MDDMMCDDIRLGIAARDEFDGGRMWRRKDCGISYQAFSFSSGLIKTAGGFKRFIEEWEPDPAFPVWEP